MSEAIRNLSRAQRQTFDRLYLDGPTPLATVPAAKQIIIRRLAAKGLALIVNSNGRGATAYVRFPLRPGDIGQLDSPTKGAYVDLIKVGKKQLIVRRTRGLAGKHIGAPFAIPPHRFIYIISRKAGALVKKHEKEADQIADNWQANGFSGMREFEALFKKVAKDPDAFFSEEARTILPLLLEVAERIDAVKEGYRKMTVGENRLRRKAGLKPWPVPKKETRKTSAASTIT